MEKGSILHVVIGNTFCFLDLLMYLIGGALAAGLDTGLTTVLARRKSGPIP